MPRLPLGANLSLTKVTPIKPLRPRGLRFYPWMSRIPAVLRRFEYSMRLTVDGPAEKIFRCSLFKERRTLSRQHIRSIASLLDRFKKNFQNNGGDVRNRTAPQRRSPIGFNRRRTVHPQIGGRGEIRTPVLFVLAVQNLCLQPSSRPFIRHVRG